MAEASGINSVEKTAEGQQQTSATSISQASQSENSFAKYAENAGLFLPHSVYAILDSLATSGTCVRVVMLRGPAGVGKTALTKVFAEWWGAEYVFYQCTLGTSEDDLLYKLLPSETTRSGVEKILGPLPRALITSREKRVVLTLDEFDKTRPSADALLLDFAQNARVSARLGAGEETIEGQKMNLFVFLTSNDEREFSEPLLRRVVSLTLPRLSHQLVQNILSNTFAPEIVKVLTQIYIDTMEAGLRKPATIQELKQLGELLAQNVSADFTFLVKSFVVKDEEDWARYTEHVQKRKPYTWTETSAQEPQIHEAYVGQGEISEPQKAAPVSSPVPPSQILATIRVKPVSTERTVESLPEGKTLQVCMKIEDKDREAYTHVIQTFEPKPTRRPDRFGHFRVDNENGSDFITTKKPLSFDELRKMRGQTGEFFAKQILAVKPKYIPYFATRLAKPFRIKIHKYTVNHVVISTTINFTQIVVSLSKHGSQTLAQIHVKGQFVAGCDSFLESLENPYPDFWDLPRNVDHEVEKNIQKVLKTIEQYRDDIGRIYITASHSGYNVHTEVKIENGKPVLKIRFGYEVGSYIINQMPEIEKDKQTEYPLESEKAKKIIEVVKRWRS